MLKLDNNLLNELGLGALPEEQKRSMLQHIYDTLELRVGTRLANQMTDAQLQEFEKFIDAGGDNNQAQALQWLETNLPNYKQVVNEVFEELKAEIRQMAPQIMASTSQAAPGSQPQAQQPVQAQPVDTSGYVQPMQPQQPAQPQQTYAQPQQGYASAASTIQPNAPQADPIDPQAQNPVGPQAPQFSQAQSNPMQQNPLPPAPPADPLATSPADQQPPQAA